MKVVRSFAALVVATAMGAAPAQAQFGSVAVIGEGEVLVGESSTTYRPGTVYIYRKAGGGWKEAGMLRRPGAAPGDGFGSGLALDGSTLFVGVGSGLEARVEVYERAGDGWSFTGKTFTPPADSSYRDFGREIAVSGEWLFIAAPASFQSAGAVFAYRRTPEDGWSGPAKLASPVAMPDTATFNPNLDAFGSAIAAGNGVLLIGAPRGTPPAPANDAAARMTVMGAGSAAAPPRRTGLVYAYTLDESGAGWKEAGHFGGRSLTSGASFGAAILLRDGTAFVGAGGLGGGHGGAFVFEHDAESGRWTETARLGPPSSRAGDGFGSAVAGAGSEIWIGMPGSFQSPGGGGAYLFQSGSSASGGYAARMVLPSGLREGDRFGASLAAGGDVAVAATPGRDNNTGAFFIYERNGSSGEWTPFGPFVSEVDEMPAVTGNEMKCGEDGSVGVFDCKDVELLSYMPPSAVTIGGARGVGFNDIWGWTDPETGREYALLGRNTGTSFVDITDPVNPKLVGDLPRTKGAQPSLWRDIKVYDNHAFIVSEARNHGMQVFDLTQLRGVGDAPATFEQTAHYSGIGSSHNLVINEESGFAYSVGTGGSGETCGGGLHMIDIRDPRNPAFSGCYLDSQVGAVERGGATHDAQCVNYKGPDSRYEGREICLSSNGGHLSIADVTDKTAPTNIAIGKYPNTGYTHQGWLSEDHRYFFMNDEADEGRLVPRTRTIIWDLAELDAPFVLREFLGSTEATDHNLYVKGNFVFESHYKAGLRILDVTDPANPVEVGYFDTAPYTPNTPGFAGTWSNFPFFPSGTIIVSGMQEGLFILKMRKKRPVS